MRLSPPVFLSVVLSFLIPALIVLPIHADPAASRDLHVSAIAQNGALIVTVTDDSGAAVADAAIAVRLPETGNADALADLARPAVGYTDQRGEVSFPVSSLAGNGVGAIKIVATKGGARAGMLFEQAATPPSPYAAAVRPGPKSGPAQPGRTEPVRSAPAEITPAPSEAVVPMVTITHGPTGARLGSGGHTKWIVIAAAAGVSAGAVFLLAGKKSSNSSAASSSGLSIGTPTVSVGAP